MTEHEKMLSGKYYNGTDPQLCEIQNRCKDLCFAYNQLLPSQKSQARELMRKILAKTGEHFLIMSPFWCDYGIHTSIGEHFFANHNCGILDCGEVTFGDHVFIGPNCGFYAATHPIASGLREVDVEYAKPIHVGSHVWFGGGVQVCPGVTIGSHVVIGAGSVVTSDIPDGVIAVGNPCRILRSLTPKEMQESLTPAQILERIEKQP